MARPEIHDKLTQVQRISRAYLLLQALATACAEATTFLGDLKSNSAKDTKKLTSLCHRPAAEVVENLSNNVANLIHSSHHVALKICGNKTGSEDHSHYNPKPVSNSALEVLHSAKEIRPGQSNPETDPLTPRQPPRFDLLRKKGKKGKATQVAQTSSVILRKGRPPPPQGLVLRIPRRLDEDEYVTRLCILTHRSPNLTSYVLEQK
eukprot:1161285-Pelagomonas_calceolata.AAC.1